MASEKKITMREYNGTDYDTLYPKTIAEQVEGIYSKEDVLSNDTKALYGLSNDATPNIVFQKLSLPYGYYGFDITLVFKDGTPIPNAVLNGLEDKDGNVAVTGEDGKVLAMANSKTVQISHSGYWGVPNFNKTITAQDDTPYTPIRIELDYDETVHLMTTSGTPKIFAGVPLDVCLVSGGQAGGGQNYTSGRGGGVANKYDIILNTPNSLSVTIGSGGKIKTSGGFYIEGNLGGDSSILVDGITVLTVKNSSGVAGVGAGKVGNNGATYVFDDTSLNRPGGSGGGHNTSGNYSFRGGSDFGGSGGYYDSSTQQRYGGTTGTGPGGGGGMGYTTYFSPGEGANGGLYVRVNFGRRNSV